jgi:DNA-binding GntR family transcriptional regulator
MKAFDALQPLDELPLSRVIADQLADAIIQGAFPAGTKLREDELASRFRTSRTPVREALRLLELESLVTFEPRKGVRVSTFTADDAAELYLLRGYLGGLAARLAAENATPAEVDALRDFQTELKEAVAAGESERYAHCVIEADDVLIRISRNRLLMDLLDRLRRQSMRVSLMLTLPVAVYKEGIRIRERMIDAIASQDLDGAEQAMRDLNQLTWGTLVELGLPFDEVGTAPAVAGMAEPRA